MTTRTPFLLTILLFPFILLSCKSTDTTGPNDSSGNSSGIKGKISGYVKEMPGNIGLVGVRVETIGSPYSAVTDSTGHYELEVPSGTYTLHYSKEHYGDYKSFNFVFTSPGIYYASPIGMSLIPRGIYSHEAVILKGPSLRLTGKLSSPDSIGESYNSYFITFYSVNPDSTPFNKPIVTLQNIPFDSTSIYYTTSFTLFTSYVEFTNFFSKGQTVYYTLQVASLLISPPCGRYWDPIEQNYVMTSIGPRSKVYSFQMP